jgi:hypothetical protein
MCTAVTALPAVLHLVVDLLRANASLSMLAPEARHCARFVAVLPAAIGIGGLDFNWSSPLNTLFQSSWSFVVSIATERFNRSPECWREQKVGANPRSRCSNATKNQKDHHDKQNLS